MKINKFFPLLLITFISVVFTSALFKSENLDSNKNFLGVSSADSIHKSRFYNERLFYEGVFESEQKYKKSDYRISGGIIPHDFLPGFMLSDFFLRVSDQSIKTIILVGPNHYEKGSGRFLTSLYDWNTPFGVLKSDKNIINNLTNQKFIKVEDNVFPEEHSVGSIMPYIKFYLPDAEVVPIIISGFATQNEVEDLSENLSEYVDESTMIVVAVDFSHYLNSDEAQEKDKITLDLIKRRDYERIFNLNNDFTDSPASLALLLMTMDKLGKKNMDVLHNTNSGILQNDEYIETTSYFSIVFH